MITIKAMAQRTLQDWLASSDEDETPHTILPQAAPQPALRASSPEIPRSADSPRGRPALASRDANPKVQSSEADERRRRLEEMKARMRNTLGDSVADKIAAEKRAAARVNQSDEYSSDFTQARESLSLPPNLPPLSARNSAEFLRKGSGASPPHPPPPRVVVEESEVMVADRGTQTACEVECQTDPDPRDVACAACYHNRFGHAPAGLDCPHAPFAGAGQPAGEDPVFGRALLRMGSTLAGGYQPPPQHSQQRYAIAGGTAATSASRAWREQLAHVETSLDELIFRLNLPQPPF